MKKARKKAKSTEEVEDLTPGIFDQVIVNWDQLDEFAKDPLNWKDHPIRQKQALASTIKANGYAKPLVFNVHLKKFLDGHGRYDVAIKEQHTNIPIALGRWTEEQHRHVLQTLDPIGAMYEVNQAALHSLNEARKRDNEKLLGMKTNLEHRHRQALQQLQYDIETFTEKIESGETSKILLPKGKRAQVKKRKADREREEHEDNENTYFDENVSSPESKVVQEVINDDCYFPSSNQYGIPDLKQEMLCPADVLGLNHDWSDVVIYDKSQSPQPNNLYCYSSLPIKEPSGGGFLGFYTEDWRFAHVYHSASDFIPKIKEFDPYALVEPDFSTYWEWPQAKRIWSTYQGRWCARFWQELGYYIIPNIRRMKTTDIDARWMLDETIKPEVVAMQCRSETITGNNKWKIHQRSIKLAYDMWRFQVCILYTDQKAMKYLHGLLPEGPEYVVVEPYTTARRKRSS